MEGEKIILILVLFLGLSLAAEVPGFFRDKPVPNKLRLGLWRKYKATDQHQSEDIRNMNTKQTEESSDIEVRHKLPSQDTAWLSHENNDASVTPYCHEKDSYKVLPDDGSWTPVDRLQRETVCDPPKDLPGNQIAIFDGVAVQKCEMQYPQYYCFTKEEEVTVLYEKRNGRAYEYKSKKITMGRGCVCGSQSL